LGGVVLPHAVRGNCIAGKLIVQDVVRDRAQDKLAPTTSARAHSIENTLHLLESQTHIPTE
jgi:hypothetical protein